MECKAWYTRGGMHVGLVAHRCAMCRSRCNQLCELCYFERKWRFYECAKCKSTVCDECVVNNTVWCFLKQYLCLKCEIDK